MKLRQVAIWTAILSFAIGSGFFLTYTLSDSADIAFYGYFYILVAGIINLIVLVLLISRLIIDKDKRKKYMISTGILLANIPIAIFYFYFVMVMMNTMRINFVNDSTNLISEAKIEGCQTKSLGDIKLVISELCWISIPNDCSIKIKYQIGDSK
jgi:hypothetical protein